MDSPAMEELSFGDDRRTAGFWTPARRRPLVTVLVVVLLAGLGIAAWGFYEHLRRPLPPPVTSAPRTGRLWVVLCADGPDEYAPNCLHGAATADDKRKIEAVLRSLPEIRDFSFESKERAYERFRKSAGEDPAGLEFVRKTRVDEMPESYHGALGPGEWEAIRLRIGDLSGVFATEIYGDSLWRGVADIGIPLCPEIGSDYPRCRGRERVSEEEKTAVLDRVRDLDGVKAVYFEDAAHALANRRRIFWQSEGEDVDVRALPEAFYVAFDRPPAKAEMEKILGRMPGVADVVSVS
ncbi:permease-like cell division protein FtsX [Microbispora sp. CA-102843]|uniref:permease-like cell division protein FtsX n=1 Tax=Microbispora sp. CA-102843 TaxID=3239952 RepID=UPI003D942447